NYADITRAIMEWLIATHPAAGEADFMLNALEESIGRIPYPELTGMKNGYGDEKIRALDTHKLTCLQITRELRGLRPDSWNDAHHARLWNVVRWLDEPVPGLPG